MYDPRFRKPNPACHSLQVTEVLKTAETAKYMLANAQWHAHILFVLYNDAAQMQSQFIYREILFYRGERQKSKTGSVGNEAQCSTVGFFFQTLQKTKFKDFV